MERKSVFITGANRGIGFEIARQLGWKGFHVYISSRDEDKLAEALYKLKKEPVSAEMIQMDVSDDNSVMVASEIFSERKITFDVLINNAGISLKEDRSLISADTEILKVIVDSNSYGPLSVIKAFLPLINKPGRIINVSSTGGSMSETVGGWSPAYCSSKTLLNAMTRHLAYELSLKNISVNAVCPGWTQTDMGGKSAPRSVEKGAETPVWLASDAPQNLTGKFFRDKEEIDW